MNRSLLTIGRLLMVLSCLPWALSAQVAPEENLDMVIYLKDLTTSEIPIGSIDSIAFVTEEQTALEIDLTEVHPLYAGYSITPSDEISTYNLMVLERAEFDALYKSDEEVIQDDLKYYRELADGWGMTLSEILEAYLYQGAVSEYYAGFLPGTEYVLWVYGLSLEGVQTSPLQKIYIKTPTPTMIDKKIKMEYTLEGDMVSLTYTPEDESLYYTAGLIPGSEVIENTPTAIRDQIQQGISDMCWDYVLGGVPLTDYLEGNCSKGASTGTFEGLQSGETYYLVAAYLDDECAICSDVTIETVVIP